MDSIGREIRSSCDPPERGGPQWTSVNPTVSGRYLRFLDGKIFIVDVIRTADNTTYLVDGAHFDPIAFNSLWAGPLQEPADGVKAFDESPPLPLWHWKDDVWVRIELNAINTPILTDANGLTHVILQGTPITQDATGSWARMHFKGYASPECIYVGPLPWETTAMVRINDVRPITEETSDLKVAPLRTSFATLDDALENPKSIADLQTKIAPLLADALETLLYPLAHGMSRRDHERVTKAIKRLRAAGKLKARKAKPKTRSGAARTARS